MSRRMRPLVYGPQDWADVKEHYDDPEAWESYSEEDEDDPMAETYGRAIAELNDLYPHHFDHDRRQMDLYDSRWESTDLSDPPF